MFSTKLNKIQKHKKILADKIQNYKRTLVKKLMTKYKMSYGKAAYMMEEGYDISKKFFKCPYIQLHRDMDKVADEIYSNLDKYEEKIRREEDKNDGLSTNALTYASFYPWYNIPNHIQQVIKLLRYSYERITKGYCEYDLMDIDYWFLTVFPNMLKEFREKSDGCPGSFIDETKPEEVKYKEGHQKWEEYLQTMENYLRNARLDYYDYIKSNNKEEWYDNIYEDIYEDINALDSSKLTKELEKEKGKQQEIDKYYEERNKGLKEGLRMFGEQMGSLWY